MRVKIVASIFVLCVVSLLQSKEQEIYFTSQTDLAKKCIEYIEKETLSICIASHRLANTQVISALLDAHKRGVYVEVIVDAETVTKQSRLQQLAKEGVSVLVWKSESKKKDHMHHSFCVFGKEVSWTGSYSFSLQKKFSHKENVMVLEDEKIAQGFLREFDSIKKECSLCFLDYIKNLK